MSDTNSKELLSIFSQADAMCRMQPDDAPFVYGVKTANDEVVTGGWVASELDLLDILTVLALQGMSDSTRSETAEFMADLTMLVLAAKDEQKAEAADGSDGSTADNK